MGCENRDRFNDCDFNVYPYPYRDETRFNDYGYSYNGPQSCRRHYHDIAVVDVHVEVPEHYRRYY